MRIPDSVICSYLKKKDTKGLKYLFEEYYRPLVLWADTFLNDIALSEDLVQELFVKLWEQEFASSLLPATLKSYLYTAVRNRALNLLDKNDPLRLAYEVEDGMKCWEEYEDLQEEIFRKIEAALENLAPRSKEVVKGVYLEGLKYKEVAEKYQISVATVKTLLVHSLKTLRKEVGMAKSILMFFLSEISES